MFNAANSPPLILASGSRTRRTLLENAGVDFTAISADIDEEAVKVAVAGAHLPASEQLGAEDLADVLAEAKAMDVSTRNPSAVVVGSDQTLSFDGETLSKPKTLEDARRQLLAMRGTVHHLHSAHVIVRDGAVLTRHVETVTLVMRDFSAAFAGRYVGGVGEPLLSSVGAYQMEGPGIQLFDRIEGDYFAVLGLALLRLLSDLRQLGILDQ